MGRICLILLCLCLILLQESTGFSNSDESNRHCDISHKKDKECGDYAYNIIKPMMAYFEQVNQDNAEMKNKKGQIEELQKELAQLRIYIASGILKDDIIKLHKAKEESDAMLLISMQHQISELKELKTEIEHLQKEIALKNEEVRKLEEKVKEDPNCKSRQADVNELIIQFKKEVESEMRKELKCESELKEKEKAIVEKESAIQLKTQQSETDLNNLLVKTKEIDSLTHDINILKNTTETQQKELKELNAKIIADAGKLVEYEKYLKSEEEKKNAKGCIARERSGVQNITLFDGYTFEVLCNSDIAGPGWTIIQQRIKGGVDFQRDWNTYRNGFGDFWDGDFFLGLEKIHKLTNEKPHELYIHMKYFNGKTIFARYDEFAISGEDDQYRLIKLGVFSGSTGTGDYLNNHRNMKFSTYDRDNDQWDGNCALELVNGGWWYNSCSACNLNGIYHQEEVRDIKGILWYSYPILKEVKMMIRPKGV